MTINHAETIIAIAERGNEELTAWAVRWLGADLPALWSELDDDTRDALVAAGVVEEVEAEIECIASETWQSDWREENGAAWPAYTLRIVADGINGMTPIDVDGWHLVGWLGPDGNRRHREWGTEDSDGAGSGLPHVDGWEICPGANMSGGWTIPCWERDGKYYTLDRDALEGYYGHGAIVDAANQADHGDAPTWEDIEVDDMDREETVYVVRDGRIEEVEILHGGIAGESHEENVGYDRWRTVTVYSAEAWAHSMDDATYETREACEAAIREECGEIYAYDDEAKAALWASIIEQHGEPDDYEVGSDRPRYSGCYPHIVIDDERYELDADDLATALADGWEPVIETYERIAYQDQFSVIRSLVDQFTGTDDDLPFARAIAAATGAERVAALAVFADWLEERGDVRCETVRRAVERLTTLAR